MTTPDSYEALRQTLDEAPMKGPQIVVVMLVAAIAALEGFDVQIMAFAAPVVSKAWAIDKATLGVILSSSLFGMAGGSIVLSPIADVVGRRPAMLAGLAMISISTFFSAMSQQVWELAISRALTGLAVGMMLALTNTLAAEFSNAKRRPFAVSSTIFGINVGAVLGGLLASAVLHGHPWNWVFDIATIIGLVLFALVFFALPESPIYLMYRVSPRALSELNRILVRLGHAVVGTLPVRERSRGSLRTLFEPGTASVVARLSVTLILWSLAIYYVISWVPQLVTDAGFPPSTATLVSTVGGVAGMISGLSAGALGSRVRPIIIATVAILCTGLALALIGAVPPTLMGLTVAVGVYGFFQAAGLACFYAAMTSSFPPLARSSGTGLVMGLGRLASGFGPYAAGTLFAAGWTRMGVSLIFAGAAVLAGLVLATGIRSPRNVAPKAKIVPANVG